MSQNNFKKFFLGLFLFLFLSAPFLGVNAAPNLTTGKSNHPLPMDDASFSTTVSATATTASPSAVVAAPAQATAAIVTLTHENIISPTIQAIIATLSFEAITYVLDTAAYNTAVWLASGANGQTPLVEILTGTDAWKNFGLDVAANALAGLSAEISDYYDVEFNLCAPPDPLLRLSLQLGIVGKYQAPKPNCDWMSIQDNYLGFYQSALETAEDPSKYMLEKFAESLEPGQNTLSYVVGVNVKVDSEVQEKKGILFEEYLSKGAFKDVVDVVTGKVKTPASIVEDSAKRELAKADDGKMEVLVGMMKDASTWKAIGMNVLSVFTNTLLSTWTNRIREGILQNLAYEEIDLSSGVGGTTTFDQAAAEQYYSGFVSTTKISLDDYSALTEFVTCPASSGMTRQSNNCVMDANFLQGVSRTTATETMTVAKAIEEGYLHGDWPLYRPDDLKHNQDPLCYTYGYCYGNLVKLRKARIIPIGWELAASSDQNVSGITLQEVVDGFNYCNSDGKADSEHKWCHLIDPNWVLKYPSQQCLASMTGEQTLSSMISGRSGTCVDSPSCLNGEAGGSCEGYGYCTREMNTWNFNGDSCPEEYAGCLSFTNADTSETGTWLFNTLEQGICSSDSAGCMWYRTNKYFDDVGNDDASDDTYQWLPGDEVYIAENRGNDVLSFTSGVESPRVTYSYDTNSDGTDDYSYNIYSYEDRIYFNSDVETCSEDSVGCSEIYPVSDGLSLNIVRNPSFEDDEDSDGTADYWDVTISAASDYDEEGSNGYSGASYHLLTGSDELVQGGISLQQGIFYTISGYAKGDTASADGKIILDLVASDNSAVDLSGYNSSCSSALGDSNTVGLEITDADNNEAERFGCSFTTPVLDDERLFIVADLTIEPTSSGIYVDAVQLEVGTEATSFHDGYNNTTDVSQYVQLPPAWLGCSGRETDPSDCDNYAAVCSSTEAGCSLYTPTDGDPGVPAVLADSDSCPEECVNYATYRQESTDYDAGEFPLYFIADTANFCTSEEVGCDEFTNLETEGTEVFSYLRACVTSEMADDDDESVYFTWEGSDQTGYQLVSYQLLKSNLAATANVTYSESTGVDDTSAGNAPCTKWEVTSEDTLECQDSTTVLASINECNEHTDILTEPDCREFYDESGNIHYRLYSDTVSISSDCTAYRISSVDTTDDDDDGVADDCQYSGGFQTTAGECRYFVEPTESTQCSAEAAGCREYTGGSSRNSSVVFEDYFEEGSYDNWEAGSSVTLSVSNESVAVDGHSLRGVTTGASKNFQVEQGAVASTCTDTEGCESIDSECTVDYGERYCGPLIGEITAGKTFVVRFWAKGTGSLSVSFEEQSGAGESDSFGDPIELTTGWQLYELGPLNTSESAYVDFDERAVLVFTTGTSGQTFYLDNVQLEQTEENVTLIKDSWVTPSICDETPAGTISDQYYLGCEEYTDQNEEIFNIYQFSSLCSESVVGCEAVYDTKNSESPYTQYYGLSCYSDSGVAVTSPTACHFDFNKDGVEDPDTEEVCTIVAGYTNCQFDYDGNLPTPLPDNIKLGPEAVYVPADQVRYAVADSDFSCEADNMGCIEVGQPTFSQDRTVVESFESVYLLNQPDNYQTTLCSNEELFCGEWASTQDGNFYFKDPGDQSCEYKTGVTIGNSTYNGWFRKDTSDFCYGTGWCSENETIPCNEDSDCAGQGAGNCAIEDGSYLVDGNYSGVWLNGDEDYSGWAAVCNGYDLCTEFIDPLATREEDSTEGTSFFYLDNESLDETTLTANDRCDGQVSLLDGCVLFNDRLNQELTYAASPSYLVSLHADVFFGDTPNSLQDPVSCDDPENNGVFTLTTGEEVNICQQRCVYETYEGHGIENLQVDQGPTSTAGLLDKTLYFGGSCIYDSDCQIGRDSATNQNIEGECFNLDVDDNGTVGTETVFSGVRSRTADLSSYVIENDTNDILKVYRDRECAEWLACSESYSAWDERVSQWVDVCEGVDLCNQYDATGTEGSTCTSWTEQNATVLDVDEYSGRNTSWYGLDYSGFAIPNQLPAEFYDQVNLTANGYCTTSTGVIYESALDEVILEPCSSDDDCTYSQAAFCTDTEDLSDSDTLAYGIKDSDYRIAYSAATCSGTSGDTCTVGFCTDSGQPCSEDVECPDSECATGYWTSISTTDCSSDADCATVTYSGSSFDTCSGSVCVYEQEIACMEGDSCASTTGCTNLSVTDTVSTVCQASALALTGTCYDNACLVGLDGQPFESDSSEAKGCRGYPEVNSPFPNMIVSYWTDPGSTSSSFDQLSTDQIGDSYELDAKPNTFVYGFNDANVCSPARTSTGSYSSVEANDDCLCSYEKAVYGEDIAFRYYPLNTAKSDMLDGVCSGGPTPGMECTESSQCNADECSNGDYDAASTSCSGTCVPFEKSETLFGWDGYCIERDSSVQLYGSSDEEDRACITWLPIDQLAGSRDAYANDTGAGYTGGDAYYCADIEKAYDIGTTTMACAESYNGDCDGEDGWDHFANKVWDNGDCAGSIVCPNGFFAVMGGCGELLDDEDGSDDNNFLCDESGDNDCPFFCVPKASYKTLVNDGELGQVGDPCLPPGSSGAPDIKTVTGADHSFLDDGWFNASSIENRGVSLRSGQDFRIYLYGQDFQDVIDYYDDCVTRGVTGSFETDFIAPYDNVGEIPISDGSTDGFTGLSYKFGAYAACTSVVQVSLEAPDDGEFNKAWTHRDWESNPIAYSLEGPSSAYLGYTAATLQTIFGKATDPNTMNDESDPYPHRVAVCTDVSPDETDYLVTTPDLITNLFTSGSCPSSTANNPSDSEGNNAMPFVTVSGSTTNGGFLSYGVGAGDYCQNSDCSCSGTTNNEACNYGLTCDTDYPLDTNGDGTADTAGMCKNGSMEGEGCDSLSDCYYSTCNYYSSDDTGYYYKCYAPAISLLTLDVGDDEDAVDLLKQIFAKSYDLQIFSDGYDGIGDEPGNGVTSEWSSLGEFSSLKNNNGSVWNDSDWNWGDEEEVTSLGDLNGETSDANQGVPTPPTVVSIGSCYGTDCKEGSEGKFTVNNYDDQDIQGNGGSIHTTVKFFAYANSNQMPLRNVLVDWGDGDRTQAPYTNYAWPLDSQTGSEGDTSYYRNRRGIDAYENEICGQTDEWGFASDACQTAYFTFERDYYCSQSLVESLQAAGQTCEESDGRLINSPCTGGEFGGFDATNKCVFQPRVHVKDNWGWCTGYCNGSSVEQDGTTGCFGEDECNSSYCPSVGTDGLTQSSSCADLYGGTSNPWINYDGVIVLDWQD